MSQHERTVRKRRSRLLPLLILLGLLALCTGTYFAARAGMARLEVLTAEQNARTAKHNAELARETALEASTPAPGGSAPSKPQAGGKQGGVAPTPTRPQRVGLAFQISAAPGSIRELDPAVSAALRGRRAGATFFIAGLWAKARPNQAASLAALPSYEIGNGGYSEENLALMPDAVLRTRVLLAQSAIKQATGRTPVLFRSAQLGYTARSDRVIQAAGLRPVTGDIDLTAAKLGVSAEVIAAEALARVHDGSIIVLPADGSDPREGRILVLLLEGLAKRGFVPVNLSQLFSGK